MRVETDVACKKSWVKWVGKVKTYSMEGQLEHKTDFQLFMQNSNMTECVVIFYCAVYHPASGVNASCICSALCAFWRCLLLNYNLFSQIADWRLSVAFCEVFESVEGEWAGQRRKRTKKSVMLLYRRSVWWLYGWLVGLVDFNLTKMFLGILESCETGCNQWDIFKDLLVLLITKMLCWFRLR